jgi:hypothetical protein
LESEEIILFTHAGMFLIINHLLSVSDSLLHDVESFVTKAKDGATRCCSEDKSECRCPKKSVPKFMERIGDWCEGVQKCMSCKGGECSEKKVEAAIETTNHRYQHHHDGNMKMEGIDHHHHHGTFWHQQDKEGSDCPTDDNYGAKCLESAMPPYPICLKMTAKEWVEKAIARHDNCCGDDLGTCKCPVKGTPKFMAKISDRCAGVDTCASFETITIENLRTASKLEEAP